MCVFSGGQSKIFQGHGDPVETAVILPDGRKSAVGYSDGSMRIFDLRTGEVVHNLSLFKNKAAICAIDSRYLNVNFNFLSKCHQNSEGICIIDIWA